MCILFHWRLEAVEWPPCGLTSTRAGQTTNLCSRVVWPPGVAGLTASLCIVYGQIATRAGQTASTFNGRILNLKVAVAIVMIWSQIELRFDHQMRKNFPTTSFWSVGYKYPSISCKISLLDIWTTYLTLESPLPSHTSLSWSIVGVWDSSAWFECF
jgi:hypothetical protein